MVSYGYFGSLCNILDLTTELAVENEDKDYYLSLWNRIYDIFVVQLLHDKEQADQGKPVSNASKYLPHENRKKGKKKKMIYINSMQKQLFPDYLKMTSLKRF